MLIINRWTLTGRLVKDPGVPRFLPSGEAQLIFSVAFNRPLSGKGVTAKTEQPSFFEVLVRGRYAETISEHLRKGSPIYIEGEAIQLAYPQFGETPPKKRTVLKARNVQFLSSGVDIPAAEEPSGIEVPE